jgi:hypothetical protein
VHLVPSASWRFWTNLTHFPWLAMRLLRRGRPRRADETDFRDSAERNTRAHLLWKASGLSPHGRYSTSLTELYYFSRRYWTKVLTKHGLDIVYSGDNSLFYSGYGIFLGMPMGIRRRLARFLGASCHVFVTSNDKEGHSFGATMSDDSPGRDRASIGLAKE